MSESVKFLLFADFHYRKGMYPPTVSQLTEILKRGDSASVDFVIHAGDFCNDYKGSPEIVNAYLNNPFGLPVYGVTGNHELEAGNVLDFVIPRLSNRPDALVFGGESENPVAYFYFEVNGFRIVCVDTNYSYSEERKAWERNTVLAKPKENILGDSLGSAQLTWLEAVLNDAADRSIPCIVIGHAGFSPLANRRSPDHENVCAVYRRVNAKRAGTVLMSINGHYHTNHIDISEGVLFLDTNTAINGHWQPTKEPHYNDAHTFTYTDYDEMGNSISSYTRPFGELRMAEQTWFFRDPLSAIVTVSKNGTIEIEGMDTEWAYGIAPTSFHEYTMPKISSYSYKAPTQQ